MRGAYRWIAGLGGLLLVASACGDDACETELSALLELAGIDEAPEKDCGTLGGHQLDQVAQAKACLESEAARGQSASFEVNNCIDCLITSTFATAPGAGVVHVYHEADHYGGDRVEERRVERCDRLTTTEGGIVECAGPEEVYRCEDDF